MLEVLNLFGLQWGSFLAQVIIILIVYLILSKYAFGPVLELLEARRRKIAEGEVNLKKIKTDLAQAEEKIRGMMDTANKEADRIVAEAKVSGDAVREQKAQTAVVEANQIVSKAREASRLEHERVMSELKADFGRLVIGATSKVTGKVLNDGDQKRINEEVAGQVSL
jgi:F-type H+-transporting ATPase subunit b